VPLKTYGVLAGRAVDKRREGAPDDTPHYQVRLDDQAGTHFRLAVNVLSSEPPSELLYLVDDNFQHPVTALVEALGPGWHPLPSGPGNANLDYVRANLFDPKAMRVLPPDVTGPDNDLADVFDHYIDRALADASVTVYAFGERWETGPRDKVFGFEPDNGVHDIHMNQGNVPKYRKDDGVWQDGGLLLHLPAESRWVGIFLAFQSQKWHTDDTTGHSIEDTPGRTEEAGPVRIVAAMANPVGPAPEHETVLLLNSSPDAVNLTGWQIADRLKQSSPVSAVGPLAAGATLLVELAPGGAQLGNRGGIITLLDAAGLKVDGVSYTAEQASREGWTIVF
jgi:uncharacterized protein YukJ